MAKQQTIVTLAVEWDDTETSSPRKWDWDALVGGDGAEILGQGTTQLPKVLSEDHLGEVMTECCEYIREVVCFMS